MTWAFGDESPSTVEFTLSPTAGGTELTLVHAALDPTLDDYPSAWQAHLDVLAAIAEGDSPPSLGLAFDAARANLA